MNVGNALINAFEILNPLCIGAYFCQYAKILIILVQNAPLQYHEIRINKFDMVHFFLLSFTKHKLNDFFIIADSILLISDKNGFCLGFSVQCISTFFFFYVFQGTSTAGDVLVEKSFQFCVKTKDLILGTPTKIKILFRNTNTTWVKRKT